jgi:four helix bundle protein
MTPEEMKRRTMAFAVAMVRELERVGPGRSADVIVRQAIRSSTSVAANYRAACLARSRAEFIAKLQIVLEEADESQLWLELLSETGIDDGVRFTALVQEARELTAMIMASLKTSRGLS